jgi:hypothetical protein
MLLDDLLGTADPDVLLPTIDPDARRRRLTALIKAASLARTTPALLGHGAPRGDIAEAENAIERAANTPEYEGSAVCDIWFLRLRALLAGTRGDEAAYRDLATRYRAMAKLLGFEGHIETAEAM